MTRYANAVFCLSVVASMALGAWSCSRTSEPAVAVAAKDVNISPAAFTLPKLFEVTLPEPARWEAVTNARRLEFSPPAVLLLFSKRAPALIRFHVFNSDNAKPGEALLQLVDQLEKAGFRWELAGMSDERGGPVSAVFGNPDGEPKRRGKITIKRIPGNEKLSVVAIGLWPAADDREMASDFDAIVGSLKAGKK